MPEHFPNLHPPEKRMKKRDKEKKGVLFQGLYLV